ncbi:glucokinase [Asticcacaulis sp. BYS171W]|uniref:Glucokinase n=1 Tax=Asticcacaulis aquaticus TaxID=2984212 RepID=A0ABT5HYX9_9CAUL|nr:glucokinase [Asticcacaulis aquaticus]MDC7685274.1 glucokinase [Asticcacaulis aquaticus]
METQYLWVRLSQLGAGKSTAVWPCPTRAISFRERGLRDLLGVQRLHIVNDCVAKAMSVRLLDRADLLKVCGGAGDPDQLSVLIGTGRGLGTAGIVPDHFGETIILPCEGGHSDLPARNPQEVEIFKFLERKYGHVSRERAISLNGLADIYDYLIGFDEVPETATTAAMVAELASLGAPAARDAIRYCQTFLADAASDAALMAGARGGIYLAGELMLLIGDLIDWDAFETRLADKGRLQGYLQDIPVYLIKAPDIELIGLTSLFH